MGHFAQIDKNNVVTRVIVAEQEFIDTGRVGDPSTWVQTSYNTLGGVHYAPNTHGTEPDGGVALRKNFAGKGWSYDSARDAFIPPKPFNSWVLNEDTCLWEAPISLPDSENFYRWNEETQNWEVSEE
jgi:hypothetical protein